MTIIKTRDGTELHVKDWGSGRPVILMHGWPLSADSWDDQAMAIADAGMRAIAYDRRGFGHSDQPWTGYDYDTRHVAGDFAATHRKADDRSIFGVRLFHDIGQVVGERHGGKGVKQAALISSVVPFMLKTEDNPKGTPKATFDDMTKQMKADRAHFFAGFFKDFYGVGMFDQSVSEEVLGWSCSVSMMAGLKPTLACAGAFATTDFRPDLPAFNVPTLIIHGTEDKTVPIDAAGRAAAAGISGSILIEYEGAPHGLFATHKDRFTKDLLAFLASAT